MVISFYHLGLISKFRRKTINLFIFMKIFLMIAPIMQKIIVWIVLLMVTQIIRYESYMNL